MKIIITNEMLEVTIRGNFGFETCRDLLACCKTHVKLNQNAKAKLNFEDIATFSSCAIATLSLLSDWMPNDLHINLRNCDADLAAMFDSGVFDKYFHHNRSIISQICNTCLADNEQEFAAHCPGSKPRIGAIQADIPAS